MNHLYPLISCCLTALLSKGPVCLCNRTPQYMSIQVWRHELTNLAISSSNSSNSFEILSTKCITQFSNNIRNNFGFLNNAKQSGPLDRDMLFMQEGRKVFKEVVPMVSQLILDHLSDETIEIDNVKRLWLHQANKSMNDLIGKKVLGRTPEKDEQPNILQDYANTSSAGSIIAFSQYSKDMNKDEIGVLCSFGAGYSAGSVILRKT